MYMSLRVCARVHRVRAFVRASVRALPPYYPPHPPPLGSGGGGETVKDIVPSPDQQGSGLRSEAKKIKTPPLV